MMILAESVVTLSACNLNKVDVALHNDSNSRAESIDELIIRMI